MCEQYVALARSLLGFSHRCFASILLKPLTLFSCIIRIVLELRDILKHPVGSADWDYSSLIICSIDYGFGLCFELGYTRNHEKC